MSLTKLEKDMGIIQKLDDEPNDVGGLSAADLKKKFDESGETVKTFLNDTLIPEIEQSFAETAKKQDLSDVVLGQIPDHTLTEEKLSEDLSEKLNSAAPKETVFTREETLTQKTAALYGLTNEAVPDDAFNALLKAIRGQKISVRVTAKNFPIPGLTVEGVTDLFGKNLTTDDDGRCTGFAIAGNVTIKIPKVYEDLPETSKVINVKDGENEEFTIEITPTPSGKITLTSSKSIKFSPATPNIDVFGVGGGGSGAVTIVTGDTIYHKGAAGGGGGGYTQTLKNVAHNNKTLACVIGSGGSSVSRSSGGSTNGSSGGTTSISAVGLSAKGGSGGKAVYTGKTGSAAAASGGDGGSGGGAATTGTSSDTYTATGNGGKNGSDGERAAGSGFGVEGGKGQGTTTRAFGEESGTYYSGGGGGAAYTYVGEEDSDSSLGGADNGGDGAVDRNGESGTANTGSGGGGAVASRSGTISSGAGGSGLIIIRWGAAT